MEKIRNLSLRKSIILYMAVTMFCSFLLSAVIVRRAVRVQENIWRDYIDEGRYLEAVQKEKMDYIVFPQRPPGEIMKAEDRRISEFCDFLQTYTVLVVSVIGSCIAVFLFYRQKLRIPIEELDLASKRIAQNDLDFQITYVNQDEMGRLCHQFERMRGQLVENNQKLWKNIEDERALRAAIAHDIRSPLSVLKGYQEMMIEYIPDGTIDQEKTVEMLSEGMKQITRMDEFIETMRKMNSLEQRVLLSRPITAKELREDIQAELNVFAKNKRFLLDVAESEALFLGDKEVILEVVENIISNALRYADELIEIKVNLDNQELKICVTDDGNGFLETAEKIQTPYFQQNIKDSLKHAGLGMYISRLYCEKHEGRLLLENHSKKGAIVTAIFHTLATSYESPNV